MKTFMIVALILTMVPHVVHGRSGGAPDGACDNVSPEPTQHGADPQTSASPFTLTIYGSPTYYVPECQYWLTFDRNGDETFRGFLALAWDMNNARVGSFNTGTDQRQTCADMTGITHTNGNEKMYVSLNWTAPAAGAGPITFRYSGVVVRTMYWANQTGPMLTESNSTTCPDFPSTPPPPPVTPTSSSPSTLSATFMTVAVLVVALFAMMI